MGRISCLHALALIRGAARASIVAVGGLPVSVPCGVLLCVGDGSQEGECHAGDDTGLHSVEFVWLMSSVLQFLVGDALVCSDDFEEDIAWLFIQSGRLPTRFTCRAAG